MSDVDYICKRCGTDWTGAPGHPRDFCDLIFMRIENAHMKLQIATMRAAGVMTANERDSLVLQNGELQKKLEAKTLEARLLNTAIDKSNEALEVAVKTQEERDNLLRLVGRLQNIIKDLGIAWRENWDCSAHPGHAKVDNAFEQADKFLWDLHCHEQVPPTGEPCGEKLPCPHHKDQQTEKRKGETT